MPNTMGKSLQYLFNFCTNTGHRHCNLHLDQWENWESKSLWGKARILILLLSYLWLQKPIYSHFRFLWNIWLYLDKNIKNIKQSHQLFISMYLFIIMQFLTLGERRAAICVFHTMNQYNGSIRTKYLAIITSVCVCNIL